MVILDLWGISFHPAVVIGLGNDLLFNSILAHCDKIGSLITLSRLVALEAASRLTGFIQNKNWAIWECINEVNNEWLKERQNTIAVLVTFTIKSLGIEIWQWAFKGCVIHD